MSEKKKLMLLFKKNVFRYVKENKMFESDLIKRIHVSARCFQYYLSGEREPELDVLIKIADVFDIKVGQLFAE